MRERYKITRPQVNNINVSLAYFNPDRHISPFHDVNPLGVGVGSRKTNEIRNKTGTENSVSNNPIEIILTRVGLVSSSWNSYVIDISSLAKIIGKFQNITATLGTLLLIHPQKNHPKNQTLTGVENG